MIGNRRDGCVKFIIFHVIIDFLKVVHLVFWCGVVGPELLLTRATRSKARLVSKSNVIII